MIIWGLISPFRQSMTSDTMHMKEGIHPLDALASVHTASTEVNERNMQTLKYYFVNEISHLDMIPFSAVYCKPAWRNGSA